MTGKALPPMSHTGSTIITVDEAPDVHTKTSMLGIFSKGSVTCGSSHWHDVAQILDVQPSQEIIVKHRGIFNLCLYFNASLLLGSWAWPTDLDYGTIEEETLVLPQWSPCLIFTESEQVTKTLMLKPLFITSLHFTRSQQRHSQNHSLFVVCPRFAKLAVFYKTWMKLGGDNIE